MCGTKYRREFVLPLFRTEALETLNGLNFYLRTLEEFIDGEREEEISGLKQNAEQWGRCTRKISGLGIIPFIGIRYRDSHRRYRNTYGRLYSLLAEA